MFIQHHSFQQSSHQAWFRGRSIITTNPERQLMIPSDFVGLTSLYGIAMSTLMQLEPYLRSFYVFPLAWWKKPQISQEYGGWVDNETSASDIDWRYIGYPVTSNSFFLQILIFFQLMLMCPVEIFFERDR